MYIILKLNFYYTKSLIYMYDYVYINKYQPFYIEFLINIDDFFYINAINWKC